MKTSSRFLLGFGIFIAVIVVAAVVVSVIGSNAPVKMLPENSPEGAVQQYLMAVQGRDYVKAYSYLSPAADSGYKKDTYDNWVSSMQSNRNLSSWKASIVKSTARDNDATVEVTVDVFRSGGLFSDPVNSNYITFVLQMENGKWLIKSPVDLYWLY
jgi:hypothetical protein